MKGKRKLVSKRSKPTRMDKEQSQRFAARVSTGILIVGGIAALIVASHKWAAKEELRSIRIIGRNILDSAEIMKQAAVSDTIPLAKLDLAAIEGRIEGHPFISKATAYRGENGSLIIEITERAPAAVTFINGAPVYLDTLGITLPYRFSSAGFDLPVLAGITSSVAADTSAAGRKRVVTGARIDSLFAREALGVADSIRGYDEGLYRQISEIRREPTGEYTLVTADAALPVRLGYPTEIGGRLRKLDRFLTTVMATRGRRQAESVDLRWKGEVVVRWGGVEEEEVRG